MSAPKNKKNPVTGNPAPSQVVAQPVYVHSPKEDSQGLNEEISRWILSILCALIVYTCIAFVIINVYHPDVNSLIVNAQKVLLESLGRLLPEPVEALLFRSGVVIVLVALYGFYVLFSKTDIVKKLAQKQPFFIVSAICIVFIAAMIWADFAAPNPFYSPDGSHAENARDLVGDTNFAFFFKGFFLDKYLLLYTFILVPLIACIFFLGIKKYDW